jgi:hypothetical protein
MDVTYDTGALVAADRGERRMWARHRALLARREVPTAPAPVVAQAWRGGRRQAHLARLLVGCDIEALDADQARAVGTSRPEPGPSTSSTSLWSKGRCADATSSSALIPTTSKPLRGAPHVTSRSTARERSVEPEASGAAVTKTS